MLGHVRRELPAEHVAGGTAPGVIGGVDEDKPRGAVEQVVQVREVVVIVREVEEDIHAQRKIRGPLPARDQRFIR